MKKFICANCKRERELTGHEAKGLCHSCYNTQWGSKNKERLRESKRIQAKKWRNKNPEKHRLSVKKCTLRHKERVDEYMKKWREENKRHLLEYSKDWKRKNPDKVSKSERPGRIRRRSGFDANEVNTVVVHNFLNYGTYTCENCRKQMFYGYHLDHIKSLILGGRNEYDNLQVLCSTCNLKKGIKIVDYRVKAYLEVSRYGES